MLAERFAQAHPTLNLLLSVGVLVLVVGLVVFARPVGRSLNWLNLKATQALGLADREPDREPDDSDRA